MQDRKIAFQAEKAQTLPDQHVNSQQDALNRAQLINLRALLSKEFAQQGLPGNRPEAQLARPQAVCDSLASLDKNALLLIKSKIQQINPMIDRLMQI